MSDLSIGLEALERSRSQLSVSSYFSEALFQEEQRLIFDGSPRYVGHELAVPEVGDYLAREDTVAAAVTTDRGRLVVERLVKQVRVDEWVIG